MLVRRKPIKFHRCKFCCFNSVGHTQQGNWELVATCIPPWEIRRAKISSFLRLGPSWLESNEPLCAKSLRTCRNFVSLFLQTVVCYTAINHAREEILVSFRGTDTTQQLIQEFASGLQSYLMEAGIGGWSQGSRVRLCQPRKYKTLYLEVIVLTKSVNNCFAGQ